MKTGDIRKSGISIVIRIQVIGFYSVRLDVETARDWIDDVYQSLEIEGTLYPEVIPDYWDTDTTYVYIAGIESPQNITIFIVDDSVTIYWEEVAGCTYNVYSSTDPYESYELWFSEAAGIIDTFRSDAADEKKFYYVTAVE